jgi:hypothetical protein
MVRGPAALVALVGLAVLAGCGEEPIPDVVTYSQNIKPLLDARCIRCHGAGGKLNDDPGIDPSAPVFGDKPVGDFTRMDDYTNAAGMNVFGLMHYTTPSGLLVLQGHIKPKKGEPDMPPPPAPKLTTRQRDMLLIWAANPLP